MSQRDLTLPDLVAIIKSEMGDLRGPKGTSGPPGPAALPFEYTQVFPSSTWVIDHDLDRYPAAVQVVDTAGTVYIAAATYDFPERVTIHMDTPIAGKAYLF